MLDVGADSVQALAPIIGLVDVEFDVTEPPEFVEAFARLMVCYVHAIGQQTKH